MSIRRLSADAFVVRVPSGLYVSSLTALARALGTKGTLVGYASSLKSRMAYAHYVR